MEKDIQMGSVGGIKLEFVNGKASISIEAKEDVLDGAIQMQGSMSGSIDGQTFIDMLFKEIEAKSPPGAVAIEEGVKLIVKSAVAAIK